MPRTASITHQLQLTIRIDTREQDAFDFACVDSPVLPLAIVRGTLKTGDYADDGRLKLPLPEQAVVERKSLADLYHTLGKGHDRFEREVERLAEYGFAAIVIEADYARIMRPNDPSLAESLRYMLACRPELPEIVRAELTEIAVAVDTWIQPPLRRATKMKPKSVVNQLLAFAERAGVHVFPCPGRRFAEQLTHRIIERWARDHA